MRTFGQNKETRDERTNRIIKGIRRANYPHNGVFYVYGIPHNVGGEASGNKTLIQSDVDKDTAYATRKREISKEAWSSVEVVSKSYE